MHTLLLALALAAAARTAAACDLYISEFVEGSTLDAIELFNPSSVDVRLGDYGFLVCHGGCGPMAMVDQYEMRLQGTDTDVVPAGGTWTYCMVAEKNDDEEVPTACDVTGEWDSDAESGNDVFALFRDTHRDDGKLTMLDTWGENNMMQFTNFDLCGHTGGAKDMSARRKDWICEGTYFWPESKGTNEQDCQWLVFPEDDIDGLGSHDTTCPVCTYDPEAGAEDDDDDRSVDDDVLDKFDDDDGYAYYYYYNDDAYYDYGYYEDDNLFDDDEPTPRASCGVFISEYVDGTGGRDAVEIYNPTAEPVKLNMGSSGLGFALVMCHNGCNYGLYNGYDQWVPFPEGATLAPHATYTVCGFASAGFSWPDYVLCDNQDILYLTGNDAIALVFGSKTDYNIIDKVGDTGWLPAYDWTVCGVGSTKDRTLQRKPSQCSGDSDWPRSAGNGGTTGCEWEVLAKDTFSGLGSHDTTCSDSTACPPWSKDYPDPVDVGRYETCGVYISQYVSAGETSGGMELYAPQEVHDDDESGDPVESSSRVSLAHYGIGHCPAIGCARAGKYDTVTRLGNDASVASGGTFVICAPGFKPFLGNCDITLGYVFGSSSSSAVGLVKLVDDVHDTGVYTIVDAIGTPTVSPATMGEAVCNVVAATQDHTLVRSVEVCSGQPKFPESSGAAGGECEWIVESAGSFALLAGRHRSTPACVDMCSDSPDAPAGGEKKGGGHDEKKGLNAGAIFGIVAACVIAVPLVAGGLGLFRRPAFLSRWGGGGGGHVPFSDTPRGLVGTGRTANLGRGVQAMHLGEPVDVPLGNAAAAPAGYVPPVMLSTFTASPAASAATTAVPIKEAPAPPQRQNSLVGGAAEGNPGADHNVMGSTDGSYGKLGDDGDDGFGKI